MSSFSNPSVASPTSQLILQTFFRFSYVTGSSLTSPGEPPMKQTVLLTSLNYSRYHRYHKRTAMYCNYIVRDILNIAIFSHRYGALPCGWKSKSCICISTFFSDNPNISESEQITLPINSEYRGSTV